LGYGLLGERKHWEALESFERSIALDATDPAAHYGAAVALDAQQRHEEAKRRCTNADQLYQARLRQQPRDWAAWVALGRCAVIAEQWARATAYFERAAQIDRARLQANEDLMKEITRSRVISGPQDPAPVP
jgi:tetratricopeptide (TPR) repeat protein